MFGLRLGLCPGLLLSCSSPSLWRGECAYGIRLTSLLGFCYYQAGTNPKTNPIFDNSEQKRKGELMKRPKDWRDDANFDAEVWSVQADRKITGFQTYFVQGKFTGLIKIGRSIDPCKRLKDLQIGSPDRLTLIGTCSADIERSTQKQFKSARIHGEWFRPTTELLAFIYKKTK